MPCALDGQSRLREQRAALREVPDSDVSRELLQDRVASLETLDVMRSARREHRQEPTRAQHPPDLPEDDLQRNIGNVLDEVYRHRLVDRAVGKKAQMRGIRTNELAAIIAWSGSRTRPRDRRLGGVDSYDLAAEGCDAPSMPSARTAQFEDDVAGLRGDHRQDLPPPQLVLRLVVGEPVPAAETVLVVGVVVTGPLVHARAGLSIAEGRTSVTLGDREAHRRGSGD